MTAADALSHPFLAREAQSPGAVTDGVGERLRQQHEGELTLLPAHEYMKLV